MNAALVRQFHKLTMETSKPSTLDYMRLWESLEHLLHLGLPPLRRCKTLETSTRWN